MLSDHELLQYLASHRLAEAARRCILDTRNSRPFRAVRSGGKQNVCTAFASRKMGRSINTESGTVELAFAYEFEYSSEVREFWDQPQPVTIAKTASDGRIRKQSYTSDFLVLFVSGPKFVEVKHATELHRLREVADPNWEFSGAEARFLPAYAAFEKIGLEHIVLSSDSLPPIRTANLGLLLRAAQTPCELSREARSRLKACFQESACVPLAALAEAARIVDLTPILQMIDRRALHARIDVDALTSPKTAWIAESADHLDAVGEIVQYNASLAAGEAGISLPSKAALRVALRRLRGIDGNAPSRSKRRWRTLVRQAEKEGKPKFVALLPNYSNCGNRRPRLNAHQTEVLVASIREIYASMARPNKAIAFRQYEVHAQEVHPEYPSVSHTTFKEFIERQDPRDIGAGRGGARGASAAAGPTPVRLRSRTPVRPFERASVDHTLLPLLIVLPSQAGKKITRKVWVTAMVDVATDFVLAIWMSLEAPSSRTDAIVFRRCVRDHERFPEAVSTDRGPDFWSLFVCGVIAFLGAHHSLSPPAAARFNSSVERLFKRFFDSWLLTRRGNTPKNASRRGFSKSHQASEVAEVTLELAWEGLLEFVAWLNNRVDGLDGTSPADRYHRGLAQFSCSGIPVKVTPEFLISTAVDAKHYKVDSKDGLRIQDRRYVCTALAMRRPARARVQVRIEPENPNIAYACVNGSWYQCESSGLQAFESLDPIERLAESTRMLEAFNEHKAVRDEGQRQLIKIIRDSDKARARRLETAKLPSSPTPDPPPPRTMFDEVRALDVNPPTEETSEVMRHVMGQKRH